jgi:hypothetical protein
VTLFDKSDGLELAKIKRLNFKEEKEKKYFAGTKTACTHSFHGFNHPIPHHYNPQPSPSKRTNGHISLDATQSTTLLAALLQNPHRP